MGEIKETGPDEVQQWLNESAPLNRELHGVGGRGQAGVAEDAWIQAFGQKPPHSDCLSPTIWIFSPRTLPHRSHWCWGHLYTSEQTKQNALYNHGAHPDVVWLATFLSCCQTTKPMSHTSRSHLSFLSLPQESYFYPQPYRNSIPHSSMLLIVSTKSNETFPIIIFLEEE